MRLDKEAFVTGFALFSMFFGAGNLILPPYLGFKSGEMWFITALGFIISAVVVPLLGILAYSRFQGTMLDFGKKVSSTFSLIYCCIVYAISITLPSPRTASVTHEMAIAPFFETKTLLTSTIYFSMVFIFVVNRSKILNILGKFLTPIILTVILSIICIAVFTSHSFLPVSEFKTPLIDGLLEGYQTFDAIGAVVVGGVLIVSLQIKDQTDFYHNKKLIRNAGIIAGFGLLTVYIGLIYSGALVGTNLEKNSSRTLLLSALSIRTLGNVGNVFLSMLISVACFTTAVGIVTGTADFMKGVFHGSTKMYSITAVIGCLLGVVMGQLNVHDIIVVAVPALMFIYPITVALILLNVLPKHMAKPIVFRTVIIAVIIFSIPDFIGSIGYKVEVQPFLECIPLGTYSLGWLLPGLLVWMGTNAYLRILSKES